MTFFIAPNPRATPIHWALGRQARYSSSWSERGGRDGEGENEFQGMKRHLSHHCQLCLGDGATIPRVELIIMLLKPFTTISDHPVMSCKIV